MIERKFTEVEKILAELRYKAKGRKLFQGYCHGLEGMVEAFETKDPFALINHIPEDLKEQIAFFKKESEYPFHVDFDKGIFGAWLDFSKFLESRGGKA